MPSDTEQPRDRLIRAARELFAEEGIGADVVAIIERAGVGSGSLYRHFGGKEELARAIFEEMVAKTRSELEAIAADGSDARDMLRRTMRVGFARVEEYGQLTIEIVAGRQAPGVDGQSIQRELESFFRYLLRKGIEQGHFREDLAIDHAVAAWFALVSPAMLPALMRQHSIDAISAATTDFFLGAIRALPR